MPYSTIHKTELLDFFKKNKEQIFSADEVYDALSDIPKSTLYRLLSKLTDEGLLEKAATDDRVVGYHYSDSTCPHHLHLLCSKCGRLEHLSESESEKLVDIFQKETSFKMCLSGTVEGICKECQR